MATENIIAGVLSLENEHICGHLTVPLTSGYHEEYDGEYEVDPLVNSAVTLETESKFMRENLVIHEVPRYIVSNVGGGNTIFIGEQ